MKKGRNSKGADLYATGDTLVNGRWVTYNQAVNIVAHQNYCAYENQSFLFRKTILINASD